MGERARERKRRRRREREREIKNNRKCKKVICSINKKIKVDFKHKVTISSILIVHLISK